MYIKFFSDFFCLLPEVFFITSFLFYLLYGSSIFNLNNIIVKKTSNLRNSFFWLTSQLFFFAFILILNNPADYSYLFFNALVYDANTYVVKVFVILFSNFAFFFFYQYSKNYGLVSFEFFILVLLIVFGTILIISSNDLLSFYLALELQSLSMYSLACFNRKSAFSVEAGLKYFVMGAFASGFFLFGTSIIYGYCGSTNFLFFFDFFSQQYDNVPSKFLLIGLFFIFISLFFKVTAAPIHNWAIDVYEGIPSFLSLFFLIVPKLAFFLIIIKLYFVCFYAYAEYISMAFFFVGFCSLFFGSINALFQKKIKRFFLYSSVSHIGFLFIALGCGSLEGLQSFFFYTFIYFLITFVNWGFFLSIKRKNNFNAKYFDELESLFKENIFICLTIGLIYFSFSGIPPLAGFFSKFFVFFSVAESGFWILATALILFSGISCFYYLRFIKILFFKPKHNSVNFGLSANNFTIISKFEAVFISFCFFIVLFFSLNPHFLHFLSFKVAINFLS